MAKKVFRFMLCILTAVAILIPYISVTSFATGDYNVSTMHTGIDNNSFKNEEKYFVGANEKSKYYVSKKGITRLLEGESEDTQNLILSQILSPFAGSCYGISSAMALAYTGKISLPEDNFYKVNLIKSTSLRNTINYYQISQFCENKMPQKTFVVQDGVFTEDPLKQIVEYAKLGTPILIGFRTADFSHEIVGCGYEHAEDGTHKIWLIDPLKIENFMCLVIEADYSSWRFEQSSYLAEDVTYLDFITLDALNPLDLKKESDVVYSAVGSSSHYDLICTDKHSSFTLTNEKGETLTVQNGELTGEMPFSVIKQIALEGSAPNTKLVIQVDDSNSYTLQNNGEEFDFTVVGNDGLFCSVQGKNISDVQIDEGQFTLNGENMEYTVNSLSTEKGVQMVNISGADPEKVTFKTQDGVTVSNAENGKVHVSLIAKNKLTEGDCTLEQGDFSIVSTMLVKEEQPKDTGSDFVRLCILLFIAITFAITLYFTYNKYKSKNKSEAKGGEENG